MLTSNGFKDVYDLNILKEKYGQWWPSIDDTLEEINNKFWKVSLALLFDFSLPSDLDLDCWGRFINYVIDEKKLNCANIKQGISNEEIKQQPISS